MGLVYGYIRWRDTIYVYMVLECELMKFFKWLKKWCWDIWFDNEPKDDDSMHLTHEERVERLKEMIRE